MVGVPKSTGCFTCRRRKIKCDETWPSCLNCQRNSKDCPGPPARHTFKDLGPRLAGTERSTSSKHLLIPAQQYKSLTQLNEKYAKNGSVVHKFRISQENSAVQKRRPQRSVTKSLSPPKSPFLRQPSPSQHHELARALIAATTTGSVGVRMSVFGPFIREVPARLGHNAALDAAVAVLVNAHISLVQKKTALEIVSPQLYLRAIRALQTCLEDVQQGMSSNTLCASVILSLVEALSGPRKGNRYLAHVGGAGRLMELQGPAQFHDSFAKEMLRFSRGGVIVTSIYERKPCFLTSPEWQYIAFDKTGLSFEDGLNTDLVKLMAELPGILRELKELSNELIFHPESDAGHYNIDANLDANLNFVDTSSDSCPSLDFSPHSLDNFDYLDDLPSFAQSLARTALLHRVQSLKDALYELGSHMNERLSNGSAAIELPSIEANNPISTSYHFTSWRDMTGYSCYWSLLILLNKVMMRLLPPSEPLIQELQSECRSVAFEICKTWEDAWSNKPIGALHAGLSFVVAHEYCEPDVQEWVLSSLNALLDYQGVHTFRWSEDVIAMMSEKLAGEGPGLSFSHATAVEQVS
ncbi:hypothetical protein HBI56_226980 [Parastagonospora nodorum]|nr:hypothetical protein HBI79_231440 [Parastagonospora nodorum]KAH5005283.1 hypothetical protein HBI74_225600 [Parastagonospora nodorum]KAH5135335.1 hypothetical protein HBH69_239300 [Parastagonospora nodorum]KAH5168923.1 hypothetical protein HBH77_232900 [Parastagonospora nodorum]KAH5554039.1 hypothetical protein HBI26_234920 [Parastagonospora nodorum]